MIDNTHNIIILKIDIIFPFTSCCGLNKLNGLQYTKIFALSYTCDNICIIINIVINPPPNPMEYFISLKMQVNIKQNAAINICNANNPKFKSKNLGISNSPLNKTAQHKIIRIVLNKIRTTKPNIRFNHCVIAIFIRLCFVFKR